MNRQKSKAGQQGTVLIVALVFLVMLTLLGLAAMGSNRLQQRETASLAEQTLAFQAAEAGATEGERWIESQSAPPYPGCSPSCDDPAEIWNASPEPEISFLNLRNARWWEAQGRQYGHVYEHGRPVTPIPGHTISGVAQAPQYVIEHLGRDPTASLVPGPPTYTLWYYRVTARGTGARPDPPAMVQTIYTKGY
jgi:type IV pilus assembly protein PilX